MSDNDRLDRIEKIAESNVKAIQALSESVASHSGDIQVLKQLVESNARSNQALADTVAEHSARTTSAIEELSQIVGTMARIFNEHINDDQRHNPL